MVRLALLIWFLIAEMLPSFGLAQTPVDTSEKPTHHAAFVPEMLEPWVEWVLQNEENLKNQCVLVGETRVCSWPTTLALDVRAELALFELAVTLDGPEPVGLPGGLGLWPTDVRSGNSPIVVLRTPEGAPMVRLDAGHHVVRGTIQWNSMPQVIPLPREAAMVSLVLPTGPVERPRRDDHGKLWLDEGSGSDSQQETDSLRISVFRRITDGVPLRIETRLELNVAGRSREIQIPSVLLADSRPTALSGPIPVRLVPANQLVAYVRPGTHTILLEAVLSSPVEQLTVPHIMFPGLDAQEVWTWVPDEESRSVELSGLVPVDPARTSLPADWRGTSTFLAEAGQSLTLRTTRRGVEQSPPNRLELSRQFWLDLDGRGYTVYDQLSGKMQQGWRLEYAAEGTVGRVGARSGQDDYLITTRADSPLAGVEIRASEVALDAEIRLDDVRSTLPIVGWDADVSKLNASIHLPPGYSILWANGPDSMSTTWLNSWTLFEFFLILLVSVAVGKLFGWPWALLGAVALTLSHGEYDAPQTIWFHLLAAAALLRVLPKQVRFRNVVRIYQAVTMVVFVTMFFPYARDQIRFGMHPQVAQEFHDGFILGGGQDTSMLPMDNISSVDEQGYGIEISKRGKMEQKEDFRNFKNTNMMQQVDPNEVVQTGPGLPQWQWRTWQLNWNGPVFRDHTVSLMLIGPKTDLVIRLFRISTGVLLALLFFAPTVLSRRKSAVPPQPDLWTTVRGWTRVGMVLYGVVLIAIGAMVMVAGAMPSVYAQPSPQPASGEAESVEPLPKVVNEPAESAEPPKNFSGFPPVELVRELEKRLTSVVPCIGECVTLSWAEIVAKDLRFEFTAEAHAQRPTMLLLPGPMTSIVPMELEVNGEPWKALRRDDNGFLAVKLPMGVHRVVLRATLSNSNAVTVQFAPRHKPERLRFFGTGWTLDGLSENGVPQASLLLSKSQPADKAAEPGAGSAEHVGVELEIPPWFGVHRTLLLGQPWQVQTVVSRARADRPEHVRVPLLTGEAVMTDGVVIEGGHAVLLMERGKTTAEFLSDLAVTDLIRLTAPEQQPWTETWVLECTRMWRCETDGIAYVSTVGPDGSFRPTWRPWPGEVLTIRVERPKGTEGAASTLRRVDVTITPGERLLQGKLELAILASQGEWQRIRLPEGAVLQEVQIDGSPHTLTPREGALHVPLKPGEQRVSLSWQQPWERRFFERFPTLDVGSSSANTHLTLELGDDRWLLWTHGPDWGPAVLFWSHLAALMLVALVLGRFRKLPVKTWQWLLLALGLSQLPIQAFAVVVVWLLALVFREQKPMGHWALFNLYQLTLIGLTLAMLGVLYGAVHVNLLFDVDMQVQGAMSHNTQLRWVAGGTDGVLPQAGVFSVPMLVWRGLMLVWALWMTTQLVRWLRWAWKSFGHEGLWRKIPRVIVEGPGLETMETKEPKQKTET
ncbi:MAG: hypothetical protein HUU55_01405 [Myxococcales bacterium]|nr:hypothetical protein [Myxococcales bacterium]